MAPASELLEALLAPRRAMQFISVGVIGAVCDMVALSLVVEAGLLSPAAGKIVSAEFAIIVMFIANEGWTFTAYGDAGLLPLLNRFLRSNLVRVGGVAVAWVVLVALVRMFDVWYVAANLAGIGVGAVVNYIFETLVTWRVHH